MSTSLKDDFLILVLTPNLSDGRLLAESLSQKIQCETLLARDLTQAKQILMHAERRFCVAVCDLNIIDGTAEHVVELMSKFSIPIIAIASTYSEELSAALFKMGVVDFVLKDSVNHVQYVCDLAYRIRLNSKTKVLLVDDSNTWRQILKFYLLQQNLCVLTANDGQQALQLLDQNPDVKLLITDYEMPKMNGDELVLEVRKKLGKADLAIIGVSGAADGKVSARFLKSGANDFINKPFFYEEIFCRVSQNLEMIELIQSNRQVLTSDVLTGLHNRVYFFEEGEKRVQLSLQNGRNLALAIIEIEHYKNVNEQFGHVWGDLVLKNVAQQLLHNFSKDLCARVGGGEFALLFLDKDLNAISQSLEAFNSRIESTALNHPGGKEIKQSMNISWVMNDEGSSSLNLDDLMKLAYLKLDEIKRSN